MIFKQNENGSCDIIFSEEEIKILNKNKKIHLSDENFKHFGNTLVKMVMDWNEKFNENIKNLQTSEHTNIKGD